MLHLNKALCSIIFKNNDKVLEQSYEVKVFPYDNHDAQNLKADDFIWIDLSKENKISDDLTIAFQLNPSYPLPENGNFLIGKWSGKQGKRLTLLDKDGSVYSLIG